MSLIHEALKRAEEQRQLGSVPTLANPGATLRRKPEWRAPLLALGAALLLVAVAWFFFTQHAKRSAGAPAVGAAGAGVAAPDAPMRFDAAPAHASAGGAGEPRADAKADVAGPATPGVAVAAAPPGTTPTQPDPQAKSEVAAAPAAAPLPPAGAVAPAPPPAQPTAAPVASASAPPAEPAPAYYWELPYAERKGFPPLSISMHVYGAAAADRFVILDGERRIEGDDLGDGLRLEAIDADGIVISHNGKRFRVPRIGGG